ncbi:hypothetical protein EXIGLDRAFT_604753, partial [Exidia glandulosa HHB12029]
MTAEDAKAAEDAWNELRVFSSPSPDNPNGAGGVGVVLNKKLVCTDDAKSWVIIPGRAMVVSVNWHLGEKLTLLAVYAPNTAKEQSEFWPKILETLKKKSHIPKPKFLLGDCNNVDSPMDRFPAHLNDTDLSVEFLELRAYLGVDDGWRLSNPGKVGYSWRCADRTKHSRIDKIFVTHDLAIGCRKWKLWDNGFCPGTDHSAISVELVHLKHPYVGEGRATMRPWHTKISKLIQDAAARGMKMMDDLEAHPALERDPRDNIQTRWPVFKDENLQSAKAHAGEISQKEARILAALAKDKESILQRAADNEIDADDVPGELLAL